MHYCFVSTVSFEYTTHILLRVGIIVKSIARA